MGHLRWIYAHYPKQGVEGGGFVIDEQGPAGHAINLGAGHLFLRDLLGHYMRNVFKQRVSQEIDFTEEASGRGSALYKTTRSRPIAFIRPRTVIRVVLPLMKSWPLLLWRQS